MSDDRQELIRRFAVAIAGAQSAKTFEDRMSEQEIWRQAAFMADVEPSQPPADDRIERALQVLRNAARQDNVYGVFVAAEEVNEAIQILEGQE